MTCAVAGPATSTTNSRRRSGARSSGTSSGSSLRTSTNATPTGTSGSTPTATRPTSPSRTFPTDRYFGKLTWQINPKHKLVGNFQYDKQRADNGLDIGSTPSTMWSRYADTPTPGLAYTGVLSNKTVLDVRFSGFYGEVSGEPTDPSVERSQPRFYDLDTGLVSGGHYYWYAVEPRRTTATAKISHLADNFLGASHDLHFGVQYSQAVARGLYGYNDFVYIYSVTNPGYGFGYDRTPFSYTGDSRSVGVFLDDTIKVNDRLTLNLGVRYDYNKAYAAAQDELDENGNPTGVTYPERRRADRRARCRW